MKQLELFTDRPQVADGLHFFRLDFGIYSRYTNSFDFKGNLPSKETQAIMIQLFFKNKEVAELLEKYGLTDFELCKE